MPVVGVERSDTDPRRSASTTPTGSRDGRQRRPGLGPGGAGLRARRRRGQLRGQGHRRPPAAGRSRPPAPTAGRARGEARRAGAVARRRRWRSPAPGCATWSAPGSPAQNYRGAIGRLPGRRRPGRLLAGRPGAAGGARRPRRPRPARSGAAPLGRLRARRGAARAPRRRARARRGRRRRRGAGAATRGRCSPGGSRPARSRRSGALALAAYATSGLGRHDLGYVADLALLLLATNLFNLLDLRPGRVEKAFARCSPGSASAPGRSRRSSCSGSSSGRCWSAPRSRCASGRCSATRARTWSGRSPGSRCSITLGDDRPAGRPRGRRRRSTIYGEFRSISRTIEGVPLLRSLDSLGRLTEGQEADPGR